MFDLFKSIFKSGAYENLNAEEFITKLGNTPDAVLLDVRTPAELVGNKIEGAVNLDYYAPGFVGQLSGLDREKTYLLYCRSGQRSANACRTMHGLGFTKLFNLSGGILALD